MSEPIDPDLTPSADPAKTPAEAPGKPLEAPEASEASLAPPPAAKTVLEGKKTERELVLERDIKDRENRISQLEDENGRLKSIPKSPPPPKPRADRWTLLHPED